MKRRELYRVIVKGKELLSDLTESEYFRFMDDLSVQFYQTGTPHPNDIITETYLEED